MNSSCVVQIKKLKNKKGWLNFWLSVWLCIVPEHQTVKMHVKLPGSGRVFSASRIWPKNGVGFGKMKNILTGFGIWLLPRKRDSPKFARGMGDFCLSVGNSGNRYDPNKHSSGKSESTRRVQNINWKGQSTSCIYGFRIVMKKCRMRDSRAKGAGMQD